jgi:hypothetical protein
MLAHIVSPPMGGHSTQRSTAPNGGLSRHVASVCQAFRSDRSACRRLVDADQPRVVGIAADDRVVLELAEMPRKGDVLGARDVLVAEEQTR